MNYADDTFSWFEHPDFLKNQESLIKRNNLLKNAIQQNKAFDIDNVFNSDNYLKEQKLETPNLTGNDQFSAFMANNPIPDLFGNGKMKTDQPEAKSNFLGTQGEGEAGAIADFGMNAINLFSNTNAGDGDAISNGLNMTMKGAQAGMAVAGPVGAGVGAGIGAIAGVYDGFADANKIAKAERNKNDKLQEKEHTELEQQQRQKDGLKSLSKLSELRKQQERFIL